MKETLKARISAEAFAKTEAKIDGCFASGHGTVLYFEDTSVVKKLQEAFPSYKDNIPTWSQHTSAMHQFAIWTMLEDMGLGASLQHYNPLIDDEVRRTWNLPDNWMMIAQMLRMKRLSDEDIRAGLEEIDTEEYDGILKKMLKQKMKGIKAANDYERSMKLIRFAVGRGFTLEEVRRFVNQVEPDEYFD